MRVCVCMFVCVESFDNCQFQTHAFVLPPSFIRHDSFCFCQSNFFPLCLSSFTSCRGLSRGVREPAGAVRPCKYQACQDARKILESGVICVFSFVCACSFRQQQQERRIMLILYLLPIGVLALIEACFCIETQQNSRLTCRFFSAPSMPLKNYEFRGRTHAQAWPGTEASKSLP